jgi:1-acyl-sn-glycerol-3-phosphate acyltransferase
VYFAATAMGVDVSILGKDVLFRIPLLGAILRRYGGIPAHPDTGGNVLHQLTTLLRDSEHCWVGIAPEGTRTQVPRWRIGFWKLATAAGVPIIPVYLHYPDKVIGVMPAFHPTADMRADIARIRESYAPWTGKYHGL